MKVLVLFLSGLSCVAATMPLGIPAPDWDWEDTVLSAYGDDNYFTYWIDNTHGSATDTSNPNGSPTTPRLTIPSFSTLTAGDVVQIRGGPYTSTTTLTLNGAAGTAENPIFIRGESPTVRPELRRQIRIRACSYVFIENLVSTTKNAVIDLRPGANGEEPHHLVIRNVKITGTGTDVDGSGAAMACGNSSFDMSVHHIVRAYNEISDCGDWQSATENDLHAFGIGKRAHDIWDVWNTAYRNGGDGYGNGHDADHTTYRLFCGGNTYYQNRENGIDLKEVEQVVLSGNTIYSHTNSSSSSGEAIAIHYGPDTGEGVADCWILNNIIYDSTSGITSTALETGGSSWWIGNRIYNCTVGLEPDRGGGNLHLFGNTVYNCADGIKCTGTIDSLELRGNIVVNSTSDYLEVTDSGVRAATTATHELYWESGGAVSIKFGSTYTTVADWISGTTAGDNSVESDPLFVNAGAANFALAQASPAIGAGYDWATSAASTFFSQFGHTIVFKDYTGTIRPVSTWDIGAFEYDSIVGRKGRGLLLR